MPTIHRIGAYKIRVYFDDHGAPHFHVVGPEGAAKIEIETLSIIAGDLPRATFRKVEGWAATNRALLWKHWFKYNAKKED